MAEPHGARPGRRRTRVWLWRLSSALAAALCVNTVWGFYDLWRAVAATRLMFPGAEIRTNWSGVGLVTLFGFVIPAVWLAVTWHKAFPPRDRAERG